MQTAVSLSYEEVEYRALENLMQMACYHKNLAKQFPEKEVKLFMENDNKQALDMMKSLGSTKRSKFIDMRHVYGKERTKIHDKLQAYKINRTASIYLQEKSATWEIRIIEEQLGSRVLTISSKGCDKLITLPS